MPKSRNDWKACNRQKRFGGSNPPYSANNRLVSDFLSADDKCIIQSQKVALRGKKPQNERILCVRLEFHFTLVGVRIKRNQWDKVRKIMPDRRKVDEANKKVLGLLL